MRFLSLVAVIAVILSVSAFAEAPIITSQPSNVYLPANQEFPVQVNFSVMASGDDLSYQWQASNDGVTWTNSSGSGNKTNTLTAIFSQNYVNGNRFFRCVVSGSDGNTISNVVTVSVSAYIMESIPQMLSWGSTIIDSIFLWIGSACFSIIDTPLLLIGVSFFALGAAIAILSRLLSRS